MHATTPVFKITVLIFPPSKNTHSSWISCQLGSMLSLTYSLHSSFSQLQIIQPSFKLHLSICLFFFTLYYDQPNLGTNHLNIYNCLLSSSLFAPSTPFWTLLVGESLKQNFKLVTFFPKKLFKGWITMPNISAIRNPKNWLQCACPIYLLQG